MSEIHRLLDMDFGSDGLSRLKYLLDNGADIESRVGTIEETPLHVAARRFRVEASEYLLDRGARIDALTKGGKSAFAHARRRGFTRLFEFLEARGASTALSPADDFAVAVINHNLDQARSVLDEFPEVACTGNPEEDRLLAEVSGQSSTLPVSFLIHLGVDLQATGVDDGSPLHIAAWFGQPDNAKLLIDAGAPLNVFDRCHGSTPLGWAVHGSTYSGESESRQESYVQLVEMLIAAGSSMRYPDEQEGNRYLKRLLGDASPSVRSVLKRHC